MGDFQLGALLGRNQSFEEIAADPPDWVRESDQASFFQVDCFTAVHSSPHGLEAVVGSTGGTPDVLRYDHGSAGDAFRVWFPEVTTHALRSIVWARAGDAASSGSLRWRLGGAADALSAPIAAASSLAPYGVETQVVSAMGTPHAGLVRVAAVMAMATVYLDDVLTVTDAIALRPDWSLEEREALVRAEHRTQSGLLHTYTWHRHPAYRVPLSWLTTAEADRLNWWWEIQAELAFTLDSSDAAAVVLCRIVNATQPIGRRIRPYSGMWRGELELEGLHDGRLSF